MPSERAQVGSPYKLIQKSVVDFEEKNSSQTVLSNVVVCLIKSRHATLWKQVFVIAFAISVLVQVGLQPWAVGEKHGQIDTVSCR